MKATLLLLAPIALVVSCTQNSGQVAPPVAPAANMGNEYGIPSAQPSGPYDPTNPPYQAIDPVNPAASIPTANPYGTPPPVASSPDLNGNVYTIRKGDSLWGISRKFNTTVDAIKEINGLTSDTIIDGRPLIIPGR